MDLGDAKIGTELMQLRQKNQPNHCGRFHFRRQSCLLSPSMLFYKVITCMLMVAISLPSLTRWYLVILDQSPPR